MPTCRDDKPAAEAADRSSISRRGHCSYPKYSYEMHQQLHVMTSRSPVVNKTIFTR